MDTIHTLNTTLPSSTVEPDPTEGNDRASSLPAAAATRQRHASVQPHASTRATTPSAQNPPPPASLSAAFKAAAFSVTQLYRAAASETDSARATGYEDAIEDLLAFLDSENLGLGDGEGWRVRQWATQRLDPSIYGVGIGGGSTEDASQDHRAADKPTTITDQPQNSTGNANNVEKDSEMTTSEDQPSSPATLSLPQQQQQDIPHTDFTFSHQPGVYPRQRQSYHARNRTSSGHSSSSSRTNSIPISIGTLGQGAGMKRKSPPNLSDYFDFSTLFNNAGNGWSNPGAGGGNDGQGPGKRGRLD